MSLRLTGPALFLLSSSLLAFEILLLRVFSVVSYHHFAYMAVGVALLGFGAGGTALVLLRSSWEGREGTLFPWLLALTVPALLAAPRLAGAVELDPTQLFWNMEEWWRMGRVYAVLALPFLVGSAGIALALQGARSHVGSLYAWNLAGSGAGALAAVFLLFLAPPERALDWTALPAAGAAAAALLVPVAGTASAHLPLRGPRIGVALFLGVAALGIPTRAPDSFRIVQYKGLPQVEAFPGSRRVGEEWGPTGWAVAQEAPAFRFAPGLSLGYRGDLPEELALFVDGEVAGGAAKEVGGVRGVEQDSSGARARRAVSPPNHLAFLDWLPTAAPYVMSLARSVLVLGSGGGLEVLNALAHGAEEVTAVELVAPLVRLARDVAPPGSSPYDDPRVTVVTGDARSFAARARDHFSLVVLPVPGMFNATAAGVHSGGEDFLNTTEAYRSFLGLLEPGGIVALTRWLRTPPRDNVRVILTAAEVLRELEVRDVGRSLVFLRSWGTGTLLVKPDGFTEEELQRLADFCEDRFFDVEWPVSFSAPSTPYNRIPEPVYRDAVAAGASGPESASAFGREYAFRVEPVTDDRPYFGRFLRPTTTLELLAGKPGDWLPVLEWGYVGVVATFIQSGLLAILLLVAPVLVLRRRRRDGGVRLVGPLLYFGGIGFGFILLEMALIQRLSLLLGHPVYAASVTLGSLLLFAGLGSRWSERCPDSWAPAACLTVVGVSVALVLLAPALEASSGLPLPLRAGEGLLVAGVAGFAMGAPFPLGVRRVARPPGGVPWAWAGNGVASVLGASLAALLAMEVGGAAVLLVGGAFYLAAGATSLASRPSQTKRL